MTNFKVAFLLDKANDWLGEKLDISSFSYLEKKYDFVVSYDHNDVDGFDIVFILGYTKILNKDFLLRNKLNLVIHESDLPKGKGFAPVQWQIIEGKNTIPICLFEATEIVDSGDIFLKDNFKLDGYELYDEIRDKQAKATFNLIHNFLKSYPSVNRTKQSGDDSFYPKRTAKDNELDIGKTIKEQFSILRIGNNEGWPSYFMIDDIKYILKIYKE